MGSILHGSGDVSDGPLNLARISGVAMEPIHPRSGYYDPPEIAERGCSNPKCSDGWIHGLDADGCEVSELCLDRAHMTEADLELAAQIERDDALYDAMKDGLLD